MNESIRAKLALAGLLTLLAACTQAPEQYPVGNAPEVDPRSIELPNSPTIEEPPSNVRDEQAIATANARLPIVFGQGCMGITFETKLEESYRTLSRPNGGIRSDGAAFYGSGVVVVWRNEQPRKPVLFAITSNYLGALDGGKFGPIRLNPKHDFSSEFAKDPSGNSLVSELFNELLKDHPQYGQLIQQDGFSCLKMGLCQVVEREENFVLSLPGAGMFISKDDKKLYYMNLVRNPPAGKLHSPLDVAAGKFNLGGDEAVSIGETWSSAREKVRTDADASVGTDYLAKFFPGVYVILSRSDYSRDYMEPNDEEKITGMGVGSGFPAPLSLGSKYPIEVTVDGKNVEVTRITSEKTKVIPVALNEGLIEQIRHFETEINHLPEELLNQIDFTKSTCIKMVEIDEQPSLEIYSQTCEKAGPQHLSVRLKMKAKPETNETTQSYALSIAGNTVGAVTVDEKAGTAQLDSLCEEGQCEITSSKGGLTSLILIRKNEGSPDTRFTPFALLRVKQNLDSKYQIDFSKKLGAIAKQSLQEAAGVDANSVLLSMSGFQRNTDNYHVYNSTVIAYDKEKKSGEVLLLELRQNTGAFDTIERSSLKPMDAYIAGKSFDAIEPSKDDGKFKSLAGFQLGQIITLKDIDYARGEATAVITIGENEEVIETRADYSNKSVVSLVLDKLETLKPYEVHSLRVGSTLRVTLGLVPVPGKENTFAVMYISRNAPAGMKGLCGMKYHAKTQDASGTALSYGDFMKPLRAEVEKARKKSVQDGTDFECSLILRKDSRANGEFSSLIIPQNRISIGLTDREVGTISIYTSPEEVLQ